MPAGGGFVDAISLCCLCPVRMVLFFSQYSIPCYNHEKRGGKKNPLQGRGVRAAPAVPYRLIQRQSYPVITFPFTCAVTQAGMKSPFAYFVRVAATFRLSNMSRRSI